MMSSKLSALAAALLATIATAAEAVSLGDLQMKSRPGEPLEATLEIRDVDITISPLLVRVAPPATYVREGVTWPQEAQDLRMARLPGNSDIVKLRVIGTQSLVTGFPLLVELNAGGHVSVRQYNIRREANSYVIVADDERAARRRAVTEPTSDAKVLSAPALETPKAAEKPVEQAPVAKSVEKPVEMMKPVEQTERTEQTTEKLEKPLEPSIATPVATPAEKPVETQVVREATREAVPASVNQSASAEAENAPKPVEKIVEQAPVVSPENAPKVAEKAVEQVVEKAAPEMRAVSAVESIATPAMPKKSLSVADLPKHLKSKLRAPTVVREYVALNGFNPEESFPVKRSMTLWSIGQLYWPSYPGALLEQVVVALRNKNPKAFQNGDPSKIIEGSLLASPDSNEVFAIDPLEAFRTIHGKKVAVPEPTQNLINAQRLSRESAGEVAAAQITARMQGGNIEAQAVAGREALATWRSEHPDQETETSEVSEPSVMSGTSDTTAPSETTAEVEKDALPSAAQKDSEASEAEVTDSTRASEEKTATTGFLARLNTLKDDPDAQKWGLGGLAALVLLLAGGFFMRRRKASATDEATQGSGQGVLIQRQIEPTTEAQLRAVDATIDEAVKNGTTAGAMGAGAMAYTQAQMQADREAGEKSEKTETAEDATDSMAEAVVTTERMEELASDVKASTTADAPDASDANDATEAPETQSEEAEKPGNKNDEDDLELGVPKDQPWLDPNDKELPPIDEEESQKDLTRVAEDRRRVANTLKEVNLELGRSAKAESDASEEYVPPLMSEPVGTDEPEEIVSQSSQTQSSEVKSVPQTNPTAQTPQTETGTASAAQAKEAAKPQPLDESRAQQEALDAKLQLANSFIDLGARDEARELLEEVRKKGTERQRENASRLMERIDAQKKEEK